MMIAQNSTPAAAVEYWARRLSAFALIPDLAVALGVPAMQVEDALSTVPENKLCLLDSPQGWTVLAGFVAAEIGVRDTGYMPRLH